MPPVEQQTPSAPIYQTATFRFEDADDYAETIAFRKPGYTYTRGYGNPTLDAFEARLADLEGTEDAMSFASGMAAIHTLWTAVASSGDRIVATPALYGGTFALATRLMPRFGVTVELVDGRDREALRAALPGAALFYTETIANPTMSVADLETLGGLCRELGVPAAVDNTFASPALCNPVRHGFGYVLHSSTKYLGGHHDHTGGVVACSTEDRARLRDVVIDTGGTMAPFEAWLAMRGIMTLGIRMERHTATAGALAAHLQGHPKVAAVHHPSLRSHPDHDVASRILPHGAGGMMAVEVTGGVDGGKAFCDALELAWVATSLGGTHTLVGHPASTTHRQYPREARLAAGISDGLVRVSVGLEDADDLIDDVDRALEKV
jgi:methionine-gamma-lyase